MEWLFGIKGAIESVSKVSLRFLASLTNVLLLPSQKGIYLSVRDILCFHFVWNPLWLPKAHLWKRMTVSDRHSQGEAQALTPPWQALAFSSSILLMNVSGTYVPCKWSPVGLFLPDLCCCSHPKPFQWYLRDSVFPECSLQFFCVCVFVFVLFCFVFLEKWKYFALKGRKMCFGSNCEVPA